MAVTVKFYRLYTALVDGFQIWIHRPERPLQTSLSYILKYALIRRGFTLQHTYSDSPAEIEPFVRIVDL